EGRRAPDRQRGCIVAARQLAQSTTTTTTSTSSSSSSSSSAAHNILRSSSFSPDMRGLPLSSVTTPLHTRICFRCGPTLTVVLCSLTV
ncbi:hypothetical protein INR49_028132, partial [Caranx melampygus]